MDRGALLVAACLAGVLFQSLTSAEPQRPIVKVVQNGESSAKPDGCRGIIVGPGVNQPDPFPGYRGFVGWESPIRLSTGEWLVGFNAGYWHASAPTPLNYSQDARGISQIGPAGGRRRAHRRTGDDHTLQG